MLDMGFLPQVRQILKHISSDRQTMLFTATMPSDLRQAIQSMMRDPLQIAVDSPNVANANIEQKMLEVSQDGKTDALLEAVGGKTESVLVFARTKRRTDRVAKFLETYGVHAERIHGDRSQAQRQKAIDSFRSGKVKVLVATDIAARGLDIPLVELVINFDLPEAKEDYVHRIGRTGRAGATGEALSFVTPEERGHWASITGGKRPPGESNKPQNGRSFGRGGDRPQSRNRPWGGGGKPQGTNANAHANAHSPNRARASSGPATASAGTAQRPQRGRWSNRTPREQPAHSASSTSW
jgi:superfamily II DNA/RNA helicase